MALLLRSSVSRARKGRSCSGKTPAILLFALKTHGRSGKWQKRRPLARRRSAQRVTNAKQRAAWLAGDLPPKEKRRTVISLLFVLMSQALASKLQIDVSSPRAQRPFGFSDVLFCL